MAETTRITVSLTPGTIEKLDMLCAEKGVKRPAVISFAIDKLWKEVKAEDK